MSTIHSAAFSTFKDIEECPVVKHRIVSLDEDHYRGQIDHFEYYWGLQKGDLSLSSLLNHIELRSDIAEKLLALEWELHDEEYDYDVVPLWMLKRDCPALHVNRPSGVKTFLAPYKRFPRIKSRAHPLFVTFMASGQLDCCAHLIYPDKKATSLVNSVGDIVSSWMKEPPAAFLVGPDVWREHRRSLSDDGQTVNSALRDSRIGDMAEAEGRVRKTTRAPCRQLKTITKTTPYAKCDMRPARARGSVFPRSDVESGGENSMGYDLSGLQTWIESVGRRPGKGTSVWEPTWLDDEAGQDEGLAWYRQEPSRDAEDALHLQTTMNGGGLLLGFGVDRSGYSSNNWAMRTYHTCLWADDPWVYIKDRPL
ncbi:hypothetical protein BD626DRAFT_547906 [Schizophyllum amplum]|uniref:Uncharacterized protein n=1 Tax=Schizophyllum amplum TaxID=97359 RepID=A0A550CF59_9AGAR|nr:hypothetical protein BD626DRAFT_547906 [Auriculariopsis ampla]